MSLMGMRDLSLLETAPSYRYPVQTYVIEQNDVLGEAINRELARDGQCSIFIIELVILIELSAKLDL